MPSGQRGCRLYAQWQAADPRPNSLSARVATNVSGRFSEDMLSALRYRQ